jgi:hypothetical protein
MNNNNNNNIYPELVYIGVGVKFICDKNDYYIWKEHKKGIKWYIYFICKSVK